MAIFQLNFNSQFTNRTDLRKDLITTFMKEAPGTGTGNNCNNYFYTVETFGNYSIILKRPGKINKGFDFAVCISGLKFRDKKRAHEPPNFDNIYYALEYCKQNYPAIYSQKIIPIINDIYNCRAYTPTLQPGLNAQFLNRYDNKTYPIELILLAMKWLFAEQDFTYWNYSGRAKLYGELQVRNLV